MDRRTILSLSPGFYGFSSIEQPQRFKTSLKQNYAIFENMAIINTVARLVQQVLHYEMGWGGGG